MNTMRLGQPGGTADRLALLGLLMALPALYFVAANILKYELGLLPGFSIYPFSPLVLLGGLGLAMAVNLYPIVRLSWHRADDGIHVQMVLRSRFLNVAVLLVGGLLLAVLLLYAIAENLGMP